MATYEKGILGAFTGAVGAVVGASWRGKNVMRSRPRKSTKTPTEVQMLQRERFGLVTRFLTPIRGLLGRYFGQNRGVRSRFNLAVSYHIRDAVEQADETFEMMYNKVMISKGDLQGVANATATPETGHQIKLTWTDNSGQGMALPTDKLLVVIYSPSAAMYQIFENAADRQAAEVTLTALSYLAGQSVHCWVSFVNDTDKRAASSAYLGEVPVSA